MVEGKRQWLKPGDLRTKKLTEYEKQRNKRIKKNYEEQEMPPGLRLQPHSRPLTPTPEEGMDPPRQEIGTQPLPPHNVQPVHEVTASSSVASHDRRGRGPTRGIQTQRIVQKNGKMLVPVPEHFRAPVGDQASKLASKIGIEVRTQLPDLSICRWNKVHDADKKPMIQRLEDQFDLQGNPSDVARTLNTQFGRRLSSFTYRLHKQYKQLKDARGEEYARSHPPTSVTLNQWTSLIDKKWNSKEFMEQSLTNVNNRMQMKTKHRCGSKSIPIIANGEVPDLAKFYKSIHYNSNTHECISSESQANYDNMIKTQAEHLTSLSVA
ncbi:uncharacterized protein LOC114300872 [Camellia sinensis]|uniref:uncharacterized protein LOC114300872 n=1 Tax=Camellia sinensis TaxID=4442 RepID=UPI001036DBD3|nr:uncharacterized protein LOC114300872 [Camellia sinensis]